MRNIKFRGKDILNNVWVYGYFWIAAEGTNYIKRFNNNADCEVFPKSVGQYTGYKAENGDLYNGDLINDNMEVYWNYNCNAWAVRKFGKKTIFALLYQYIVDCDEDEIKIIGNIYENMGER